MLRLKMLMVNIFLYRARILEKLTDSNLETNPVYSFNIADVEEVEEVEEVEGMYKTIISYRYSPL